MFHDTQLYSGGVHASYEELMTLPDEVRKKMYLYHYGDNWDTPEKWAGGSDKYTGCRLKMVFWVGPNKLWLMILIMDYQVLNGDEPS